VGIGEHLGYLLIGTMELVGPHEKDGWPLAGTIVYIAWSEGHVMFARASAREGHG
jgi:hypothetical protein